jgi:hypothetical protein
MPLPAVRKISETIVAFGGPIIQQLDPDLPYEVVRSTFEVVILVWNAHVMAMPRWGQPRHLAELHSRLQDPQMPAPMVDAFRELSRRRTERFASDARAVGDWSIAQESGQWRLRCDARTPDATLPSPSGTRAGS